MLLTNDFKDRELDIIRLMARGLTNTEIARKLYLARETIRWYNKQIYTKLGVHNRTHAVTRAQELGLLDALDTPLDIPSVQYVKSNDAYIAYQTIGSGDTDILYMSGFVNHLECTWEQPRYTQAIMQLATMGRVILMDRRGFGLSDRVLEASPTLEQTAEDMHTVLKAVGSKQAIIFTTCEGVPAATLCAVNHPEIVKAMILVNAIVKGARSPGFPWAMPEHLYEQIYENVRQEWGGPYALNMFVPDADGAFRQWWAKFLRLSASPGAALQAVYMMRDIDVSEILPRINMPALVIHARDNQIVRVGSGRYIASQIPDSEYVEVDDNTHLWWWNAEKYLVEIERFCQRLTDDCADSQCA